LGALRELTLEISLLEVPLSERGGAGLLADVLTRSDSTHFLKIRSEGFLMICRVPSKELPLLKGSISGKGPRGVQVKALGEERSGVQILQVSGNWQDLASSKGQGDSRVVNLLKSVETEPIYRTRNPSFDGRMLRVSLVAEQETIKRLLEGMKHAGVPFRVTSLGRPRVQEESAMDRLTARQAEVLRLAHTMGYYDVPKKARVEDIASLLGMDKGTVGEHLRRAEKHVFDDLLS
jgi:hypothetical protein